MRNPSVNAVTVAILMVLSTASIAIAANDDGTMWGQSSQQNPIAVRNERITDPSGRIATIPRPAPNNNDLKTIELFSVADGSVRVLIAFQATDPYSAIQGTSTAGIPYDIWCMIHLCKRWG